MLNGTFTVESSDNAALPVGASVPLSIDDSVVAVTIVTETTVTVGAIPPDTASDTPETPTDASDTTDAGSNELAPGVPKADEVDTGLDPGETPAPDSVPPATA
jgi:hypothetical protein